MGARPYVRSIVRFLSRYFFLFVYIKLVESDLSFYSIENGISISSCSTSSSAGIIAGHEPARACTGRHPSI